MREDGPGEDEFGENDIGEGEVSESPVSPYLTPEPPERRSVIPPSRETYVFPSGRAARPVEDYLMKSGSEDGSLDDEEPEVEESAGSLTPGAWPQRDPGGTGGFGGDDGSRRMWGLPPWAIWAALGVIVVVVGLIVFGRGSAGGPKPTVLVTASPTVPAVPSYFDDGIAADEYPASAASRGEDYPAALTMADWVWERVGSDWAIVLVSGISGVESGDSGLPTPVVYLVSPEGVYFELAELPSKVANGATLVSWHEEDRSARIVWDRGTRGGLLHLETGEVEDTSFQMTSGRSKEVQFLAANATGREVWLAWSTDFSETRYFSWTSDGGWERILSGQDDLYMEWMVDPVGEDGSAIALQIFTTADSLLASDRSLPPGTPNFVVYSLEDNESTRFRPSVGPDPNCWFTGWIDLAGVGFSCWSDDEGTQTDYRVTIDGSGTVSPYQAETPWFENLSGQETAQHPDAPIELVVDPASGWITAVRLAGEEEVTIVDEDLLGDRVAIKSFDEVSPGVYRLVTWDPFVIGIDTETATVSPMLVAQPGSSVFFRSYVFFGEATPAGVGLFWGGD